MRPAHWSKQGTKTCDMHIRIHKLKMYTHTQADIEADAKRVVSLNIQSSGVTMFKYHVWYTHQERTVVWIHATLIRYHRKVRVEFGLWLTDT